MATKSKLYQKKINTVFFTSLLCIGTSFAAKAQSDSSAQNRSGSLTLVEQSGCICLIIMRTGQKRRLVLLR
jgi:hypothetical protein